MSSTATRIRHCIVISVLLALVPAAALGARSPQPKTANAVANPVTDRVLLVTFSDRPDRATGEARLSGLGVVRPSVPEIGVWELRPRDAATARERVLTRDEVVRAHERRAHRPPPPAAGSASPGHAA
jgi:hypothetical protein